MKVVNWNIINGAEVHPLTHIHTEIYNLPLEEISPREKCFNSTLILGIFKVSITAPGKVWCSASYE